MVFPTAGAASFVRAWKQAKNGALCRYTVDCQRQLTGINGRFTVTGAKCLPQQRGEMKKELEIVELEGVDTQPFTYYGLAFK